VTHDQNEERNEKQAEPRDEVNPLAVAVLGVSPSQGTGLGPMFVTVTGTGFPTTPGACQIVMKNAGGTTVGQSAGGTAVVPESFSAAVTFDPGTPSGALTPWLVANSVGSAGPRNSFALTVPPVPQPGNFGQWAGGFGGR